MTETHAKCTDNEGNGHARTAAQSDSNDASGQPRRSNEKIHSPQSQPNGRDPAPTPDLLSGTSILNKQNASAINAQSLRIPGAPRPNREVSAQWLKTSDGGALAGVAVIFLPSVPPPKMDKRNGFRLFWHRLSKSQGFLAVFQ